MKLDKIKLPREITSEYELFEFLSKLYNSTSLDIRDAKLICYPNTARLLHNAPGSYEKTDGRYYQSDYGDHLVVLDKYQ